MYISKNVTEKNVTEHRQKDTAVYKRLLALKMAKMVLSWCFLGAGVGQRMTALTSG